MVQAVTAKFSEFVIHLGDGATPEVFTKICGLTSKGVNFNNNTTTTAVPDCDDEELPAFEEEDVTSQQIEVSGSGVWSAAHHGIMLDWALDGTQKNIKLEFVNAPTGTAQFLNGPAILKTLGNTGGRGERRQSDIAIAFANKPTKVLAP